MERQEYLYDAFISYRHLPEDMDIARKLHTLLERRKDKNGKPLRVFQDRLELPTSSDLGADIRDALARSRFLIVICTPDYQQSKWCMEELNYFRELHGQRNNRILPLLVSGEPKEAFPQELLWEYRDVIDEQGVTQRIAMEIEPLGADVRGDSRFKRMWLLQTEYLRIAAPILGVRFDDLYQRAQRRKWTAGALVLVALLAFLAYSLYMLDQINQKQQAFYESQSLRLANEAMDLAVSDPELAMLLADRALPENLDDPAYAIVPEAELLMRSAVLQRTVETQISPLVLQSRMEIPFAQWEIYDVYPQEGRIIITDYYRTCVYDLNTGHMVGQLDIPPAFTKEDSQAYFVDGGNSYLVYHQTETEVLFVLNETASGTELGRYVIPEDQRGEDIRFFAQYDREEQRCYLIREAREGDVYNHSSLGWFALSGEFTSSDAYPDDLLEINTPGKEACYLEHVYRWSGFPYYYDVDSGALSEEAQEMNELVEAVFDEYWGDYHTAFNSDQSLCIVTHAEYIDAFAYTTETALLAVEGQTLIGIRDGRYVVEPESGLLLCMLDNSLLTYIWKPENVPATDAEETFEYVAANGSFVIDVPYDGKMYSNSGQIRLFYTHSMDQPVLDIQVEQFRVSANEKFLVYTEPDAEHYNISTICIYDIARNQCLFRSEPMAEIHRIAIDGDGTHVAWIEYGNDGEHRVHVLDVESGEETHNLDLSTGEYPPCNIELQGEKLVVQTNGKAFLYDFSEEDVPEEIECYVAGANFYGDWAGSASFTSDGLLILGYDGIMGMGQPTCVAAIYDLKAEKQLSFLPYYSDYEQNYLYDEAAGTLVIQVDNRFYGQRRNGDGDFETVYTIEAKGEEMKLNMFTGASDGTYFIINGEQQCEIYSILDGMLLCVLKNENVSASWYGVAEGMLYDLRLGQTGTIRTFPLLTTQQAREASWEMLTRNGIKRELTSEECLEYYIPEEA